MARDVPDHIPLFAWRVESTRSSRRIGYHQAHPGEIPPGTTKEELRDCVSAHLMRSSFAITSLTGSLLWALNYAHWLLRKGYGDINVLLIDTGKIPEGTIYPASFLVKYLEIQPLGISWHDNPYHEYLAFGNLPAEAVLGSVGLRSSNGPEINTLLPSFSQIGKRESLHDSLWILQAGWKDVFDREVKGVPITDEEVQAAQCTAFKFVGGDNKDLHFQVAIMFLSLRKRVWNREAYTKIQRKFEGASIPKHYLYKTWASPIEPEMQDVVEWVKSMEQIRWECAMANARTRLCSRRREAQLST